MEYRYEVPIVVKVFGDEEEVSLSVRKSISNYCLAHMSAACWRDFISEDVGDLRVESRSDRLLITLSDEEPYTSISSDLYRDEIESWCRYGYFDGGVTLPGRYYGYPHEEIVVYLSSFELPVESKTRIPAIAK